MTRNGLVEQLPEFVTTQVEVIRDHSVNRRAGCRLFLEERKERGHLVDLKGVAKGAHVPTPQPRPDPYTFDCSIRFAMRESAVIQPAGEKRKLRLLGSSVQRKAL